MIAGNTYASGLTGLAHSQLQARADDGYRTALLSPAHERCSDDHAHESTPEARAWMWGYRRGRGHATRYERLRPVTVTGDWAHLENVIVWWLDAKELRRRQGDGGGTCMMLVYERELLALAGRDPVAGAINEVFLESIWAAFCAARDRRERIPQALESARAVAFAAVRAAQEPA